jgi:preprotein translocase subunit SecF
MLRFRLIKDKTHFDIMGVHKITFAFSILLTVAMFALLFTRGLNLGIDFTGGVLMEVKMPAGMHIEDVRTKLAHLSTGEPSIQEFGQDSVMIKIPGRESDATAQKALREETQKLLGEGAEFRRTEYVGPQVGGELITAGIKAFVYSMIGILAYVWFRFEWQFGLVAVLALAHDMFSTILFFTITHFEFSLSTVAAALLIAGYSINETVVVFDRIREMMRKHQKMPMSELINLSINDVLSRTLMTFVLTFVAILSLVIFGGHVIRSFAYAMLVGILFGPYSSIFISAPLLTYMKLRK